LFQQLHQFKVTEDELKAFYKKNYEQLESQWSDITEPKEKSNQENIKAWEFKTSLESLITNNKALMTIPAPLFVSLVALQQPVETAPTVQTTTAPAPTAVPGSATGRDGKSWFNHDLINPFVIDL
jgi:hypothetical protein